MPSGSVHPSPITHRGCGNTGNLLLGRRAAAALDFIAVIIVLRLVDRSLGRYNRRDGPKKRQCGRMCRSSVVIIVYEYSLSARVPDV